MYMRGSKTMTALPHSLAAHLDHEEHAHHEIGWLKKYLFSSDHKTIGIQFLFLGLIFFVVGGMLAMVIRWQLAWPSDGWVDATHPGHPVPILAKMLWPVKDAAGVIHGGAMPPEFYNVVFTMHATIMIFFVLIPLLVGTFGNYLIPLKIGAGDMAFPFLNGMAFWSALPAGTIMVAGFFLPGGAASSGWTSYPPVSAILFNGIGRADAAASFISFLQVPHSTWPTAPILMNFLAMFLMFSFIGCYYIRLGNTVLNGLVTTLAAFLAASITVRGIQVAAFDGQSCWFLSIILLGWFLSIILLGFSSIMGAINYLTTIIKLRCPGMTMFRLPLSVWSLFITSLLVLLATPVLAAVMTMNLLDHHRLTSFFEPFNWVLTNNIQENSGGGYPLLHPHLFWFYSHPAVYIMILPAMGMVSDIIAVFARKPIFGYRPMVYAMAGIAFLGFIVWGHHMFQSGMNPTLGTTFAVSTMFIAVPSAIKTFNWLGTVWGGNIRFTVPMLNALAFVSMFVIGGLSGIFMASTAVDLHIHMTYFIVAHIHYVLFGGSTFGIFASIYFWYPKMFGRMMNDTLGYIHFWISFVAFNCTPSSPCTSSACKAFPAESPTTPTTNNPSPTSSP